jgi:two-component system nitrate/nitrite response regulator NarL
MNAEEAAAVRGVLLTALGQRPAADAAADAELLAERTSEALDLTERQLQVLQASARGRTIEQTARELGLAPTTVRSHRRHILETLEAVSTAQAVAIAFRKGLLK